MKKWIPNIKGNEGLTLIELAIAVFIMTIGVVSLMLVLVNGERANRASEAKTLAMNAAEERMEAIFRADPTTVMAFNGQTFDVGNLIGTFGPTGDDPGMITVANTQPRQVTITVQWIGTGILPGGTVTLRALRSMAVR